MIKLTFEFKDIASLNTFVSTLGVEQVAKATLAAPVAAVQAAAAPVEVVTGPTPQEKAAATKLANAAKAAAGKAMEAAATPAPSVSVPTGTYPASKPAVQQQASVASSSVVTIDRQAYIQRATELVAKLKTLGIPDGQLMPLIHPVFDETGCDKTLKISQLDDASLSRFLPAFERTVKNIVAQQTPAVVGSFI